MSPALPLPPGRFGPPWIGESLAITRSNHGFFLERFAQYGPIFRTRLFGVNFAVFSGSEAFHLFATDPRIQRGGTDPLPLRQMFPGSLLFVDGEEHHARKRVMLHAVRDPAAIAAYLPTFQEHLGRTVDAWYDAGSASVMADLQRTSATLSAAMLTGDLTPAHVDEVDRIFTNMREAFETLPLPIPGTAYGRALKSRRRAQEIVDEMVARHRSGGYDDVISRVIAKADADGVPMESLRGDLLFLLFAAQAGYFGPLALLTMVMGQRPDLMGRALEEVRAVSPDGEITREHLERLTYLTQLARELRRYFPMNSSTFFGRVTEDIEVGGYRIPAGWGAIGGVHITLHSPEVFAEPERFDPDRFSPEAVAARAPGSYVPHGDGLYEHHRCAGEDLVTVACQIYLVLLLRRGTWSLPAQDLALTNELFPLPASGVQIALTRHP